MDEREIFDQKAATPYVSPYQDYIDEALAMHPDCSYGDWDNGLDCYLRLTVVVNLWRNEECYLAGDRPRYTVGGFVPKRNI